VSLPETYRLNRRSLFTVAASGAACLLPLPVLFGREAGIKIGMRAFREVSYGRMMIPDHTPQLGVDSVAALESWAGWAFALGYMKALLKAVNSG